MPQQLYSRYLPKRNENIYPQKDFSENMNSNLFIMASKMEINICPQVNGLNKFGIFTQCNSTQQKKGININYISKS